MAMFVSNENPALSTSVNPVPGDMGATNVTFCVLARMGTRGSGIRQGIAERVSSDDGQEVATHRLSLLAINWPGYSLPFGGAS